MKWTNAWPAKAAFSRLAGGGRVGLVGVGLMG
jgi:hypothetical protein